MFLNFDPSTGKIKGYTLVGCGKESTSSLLVPPEQEESVVRYMEYITVDVTIPESPVLLIPSNVADMKTEEALSSFKVSVIEFLEANRDKELSEGFPYTFPLNKSDIAQIKDANDRGILTGLAMEATLASISNNGAYVGEFRALSNTTYIFTADEMLQFVTEAGAYVSGIFKNSWRMKDHVRGLSTEADILAYLETQGLTFQA